jgi:type VI secretion system protein ImpE
MQAEQLLREGRIADALKHLTDQVRENPADPKLRVFLFQLLSVLGQWDRAMTQLNVAAEMDPATLLMAQVCRTALNCEAFRTEVFAGRRLPVVFGEPDEWVGWMVQAAQNAAEGQFDASQELRQRAFEAAPATAGTINDEPFEWIADADSRLGPILETVVEGRYYWVPFQVIAAIDIEAPSDLRDMVWVPSRFTWANGGTSVGLIPTRYAGSESSDDPGVQLGRRTDWDERPGELYVGLGQRMLATDQGEYPLLEVRRITLQTSTVNASGGEGGE